MSFLGKQTSTSTFKRLFFPFAGFRILGRQRFPPLRGLWRSHCIDSGSHGFYSKNGLFCHGFCVWFCFTELSGLFYLWLLLRFPSYFEVLTIWLWWAWCDFICIYPVWIFLSFKLWSQVSYHIWRILGYYIVRYLFCPIFLLFPRLQTFFFIIISHIF